MRKKTHLPIYGVGPLCVAVMVLLLAAGLFLCRSGCLASGEIPGLRLPLRILGVLLLCLGLGLWVRTVVIMRVGDQILSNHLVVTGTYAWVRNPIYSAFALMLTGIGLLFGNLWLLLLFPLFWLDITLFVKGTEEKWLLEQYGSEYRDYCRRVNRCIPWFPRKRG